jgi:hypothetical protein
VDMSRIRPQDADSSHRSTRADVLFRERPDEEEENEGEEDGSVADDEGDDDEEDGGGYSVNALAWLSR